MTITPSIRGQACRRARRESALVDARRRRIPAGRPEGERR
jgi:hypothetical protein